MKNKILLTVVLFLVPVAIISSKKKEPIVPIPTKEITVKLKMETTGKEEILPLEEYIIGVVAAEMPASFHMEALKAQAIAARTFVVQKLNEDTNDISASTYDQAYIDETGMQKKWKEDFQTYYTKIAEAVKSTEGKVIMYDNVPIKSYYFAFSNGYTENAQTVFQETKPYLVSVPSKWDNEDINKFSTTVYFPRKEFCKTLAIDCDEIKITSVKRNDTHHVETLDINGKEYTGISLRKILGIRSTDFELRVTENIVEVTTTGYGHGVGMSQYGANGMAKEGKTYQDILAYYYQGTTLSNI